MKLRLAKLWPSLVTLAAVLVNFLAPSVQVFISSHPRYAVVGGALWAIATHLAHSPIPRTPRPGETPQP